MKKSDGLPDGFGVFVTSDGWVHCASVKDGLFEEGRIVSVHQNEFIFKLT